jgi:hypothetical protein
MEKPVPAAINDFLLGGYELAMSRDIRIASNSGSLKPISALFLVLQAHKSFHVCSAPPRLKD